MHRVPSRLVITLYYSADGAAWDIVKEIGRVRRDEDVIVEEEQLVIVRQKVLKERQLHKMGVDADAQCRIPPG